MSNICVLTLLAASINNLAEAIKGAGSESNVIPITTAKPAPAAAAAKPAPAAAAAKPAGGNASSLEKARAAAKAKKDAEAAAAASDAEMDLGLLDGGSSDDGEVVTLEELRALGMEILKAKKQGEMKKALQSLGAEALASLSEDKYAEAKEALQAILL
jgi:hypothetical protein